MTRSKNIERQPGATRLCMPTGSTSDRRANDYIAWLADKRGWSREEAWQYALSQGAYCTIILDGVLTNVRLPYYVRLNPSRDPARWLNKNCRGWYASRKYWSDSPPIDYSFELKSDAALAKLFAGGVD
jgi:hypothetical protein